MIHMARNGGRGEGGSYRVYVGKPEGNGPLGRYMRGWDNTKMNLIENVWQGVDRTQPASDRDKQQAAVNSVMQCFSTFVRPRAGKLFFHNTRARSQQIYS